MKKRTTAVLATIIWIICVVLTACGSGGASADTDAAVDSSPAKPADVEHNSLYADEIPPFSVAVKNVNTGKEYAVRCNYTSDKEEIASAYFPLPDGEYSVSVYLYDEKAEKDVLCATETYTASPEKGGMTYVRIDYDVKAKEITVSEQKTDSRYQ